MPEGFQAKENHQPRLEGEGYKQAQAVQEASSSNRMKGEYLSQRRGPQRQDRTNYSNRCPGHALVTRYSDLENGQGKVEIVYFAVNTKSNTFRFRYV